MLGDESAKEWNSYGDANDIFKKVKKNSSKWHPLNDKTDIEIQEMANSGAVIIGVSKSTPLDSHGHVAIVSPAPPELDMDKFGREGPMIRDGNLYEDEETGKIHPKDYGTVRATKAFKYKINPPQWYQWTPSHTEQ